MKYLNLENAKTVKGEEKGYITGILYLAPSQESGVVNVCPMAKIAQCEQGCLFTAGRGKFDNVRNARIRRTREYADNEQNFLNELVLDIHRLLQKARKEQKIPLVRLNGTSDIFWETKSLIVRKEVGEKVGVPPVWYPNLMAVFPHIQFYDYTKIASRDALPENYDLTFSYSGVERYQYQVQKAIEKGMRMAVVFRDKNNIPDFFMGKPVVNGDETDLRHLDPQGVIISLYAKGKAVKDETGFVVDVVQTEKTG